MTTDVVEIRKNTSEVVRVERTEYHGLYLVAVRVWAQHPSGDAVPTRKGLTLRPETWTELLPAIRAAANGVRQQTA